MFARYLRSTNTAVRSVVPLRSFHLSANVQNTPSFSSIGQALSNTSATNLSEPKKMSGKPTYNIVKYVLHCNFTKNNTILTLTSVEEDPLYFERNPNLSYNEKVLYYMRLPEKVRIGLSTGHVGFKKAARGEYEAGFQTAAKMFQLLDERGILNSNQNIELVFRDFGKGRDAFIAALQGKEGTKVRSKISRLSDTTKIKFGGVRAPRQRRL